MREKDRKREREGKKRERERERERKEKERERDIYIYIFTAIDCHSSSLLDNDAIQRWPGMPRILPSCWVPPHVSGGQ